MARPGRKRILILVENLPVPFDRRVWMEATTLRSAGYQVSVICPRGGYPLLREVIDGVRVYRYPLPSLPGIAGHLLEYTIALTATFALTCAVALREGFDAIHSTNPPDLFFLIALVFKPFGKKFVFDQHDLAPEICESRWRGWKRALLKRLCLAAERSSFRAADRVIATNESYRAVALERGGLAPERVAVVRSAPSLARFRSVPASAELRAGARFLAVYVGVMGPNDGLDHLLHAIAHVVRGLGRTDIRFVLIGAGDLYGSMVELSRKLELEDFVRFTGRISDPDMLALLSSADLCLAPDPHDPLNDVSTFNKIVEYMAMGKPIVAFDLRETRVSAGDAAAYVSGNDTKKFGDAIVELLAAPERRSRMGTAGRRRFETVLAWEHQEAALLGLYADLIGEPTRAAADRGAA